MEEDLDSILKERLFDITARRREPAARPRLRAHAESAYPGWLKTLLTHPVRGLERYGELFAKLQKPDGAIKIFCEVAPL